MSMISYIKSVADGVINETDDLDPICIVKSLKRVEYNTQPLTKNINGFYKYISPNRQMIVVNENLNIEDSYMTLFHELSHYFLEHKNNLLLNSRLTMHLKEEYEADLCATYLYLAYVKKHRCCDDIVYPKRVYELIRYFK
ncbi:Zn-dependent peptidase ImmA (M78 family) [Clostridium beijerinckii]|nr:Zn-dependent peptidase ImmA (M78 family) [Clostridium beijerinckii]MBA8935852.1 Zn-dependent peptidase ImmA (M78 family) [Clostridium beijerinckii]NRU35925.1 Zn-dependent peptidase ImmA (M78 family) [Clostridium beijerinckii]NRU41662.1 Zn-dependent peptidase ImmA (M78 family) [Clostridium beijerinckii]NSB00794.1 Zn-dependent peptidase ImmA (M78 family) [Clostridium beijerinckii]